MSRRRTHETPSAKVDALLQIEALIEGGVGVRRAVETIAEATGIGVRTLFLCRKLTDFLPRTDWALALARKVESNRDYRRAVCHPEAVRLLVDLRRKGIPITEGYREVTARACAEGWGPLPSERTLRRELDRHRDRAAEYRARRNAQSSGPSDSA